jgi:hypothetical protein
MKSTILTTILSSLIFTACGTAPESSQTLDAASDHGSIDAGEFRVYETARQTPILGCDVYTKLSLANGIAGPIATLEKTVEGPCEIAIDRAVRVFDLKELGNDCGSRHYEAGGFLLVDNRKRTCKDMIDANLIVRETTNSIEEMLITTTFYSLDHRG